MQKEGGDFIFRIFGINDRAGQLLLPFSGKHHFLMEETVSQADPGGTAASFQHGCAASAAVIRMKPTIITAIFSYLYPHFFIPGFIKMIHKTIINII